MVIIGNKQTKSDRECRGRKTLKFVIVWNARCMLGKWDL